MKVVILNDSSVAKGGATGLALTSARLLNARGIETTFVTGDAGDDGALAASGVQLVPMGGKLLLDASPMQSFRNGIYNTRIRNQIAQHLAKNDTPETVYHLHGWSRILSPSVFDALKPFARRTFIHAHDFFLGCPNGAFYDFRKSAVCTRVPLSTDCLITNCDRRSYPHKLWRSLRGHKLRQTFDRKTPWAGVLTLHQDMSEPLIRSGIPANLIRTVRNPARPFLTHRISAENNDVFCFIGRVESGKGINMLCAAARQEQLKLRVIGDGSRLEVLRLEYPEVEFTGWLDQHSIGACLTDVRALVMPSRTPEPFGLVAAEASLSGLPVILSRQALLASDVEKLGLGFATQTDTPEQLAVTLRKMADLAPSEIKLISLRGFEAKGPLAQTPEDWISDLMGHYSRAIRTVPAGS